MDKSICTYYCDFGRRQDRFGKISWSKNDSNYLGVTLKVFKRDNIRDFRLVHNVTMGEVDFNQFMQLRKQRVIAAETFGREENMSPVLIPTMSIDIDDQPKKTHKAVSALDWANRKICVTLLLFNVDKPESSYAHVRLMRGRRRTKFQQFVHVNYKLREFISLFSIMTSV